MRVFFDTSTLLAAIIKAHPAHASALLTLQRVQQKAHTGFVAAHTLAELYANLTRLPIRPRIPPKLALQLIQHNVIETCQIISLSGDDYVTLLTHLARLEITGAAIYDALLLHAAWIANVDQVITLNLHDFRRVYPQLSDKIVSPLEL